jgi:CheY-like chemotaxis protein/HPt (histidine-containing phosphotransfer) domain-containing protein
MNRFLAAAKELEVRATIDDDTPEIIYGDEVRIRQIFTNLVSNAIKYTKTGFVEIALSVVEPVETTTDNSHFDRLNDRSLAFTVRDSGIGIKEEDIPKIFETFARVDAQKNINTTGTGLGLPIVKQLVELMNGTLEVKSEYGKGSVFTAFLPYKQGDVSQVAIRADDIPFVVAANIDNVHLLVVDDLPVNLTVALGFLQTHGMQADTAESGKEALEKVSSAERPYDIIFMDHMMPEMDGIETTKRIREMGVTTPIIALTANAVAGAREMFLQNGFNGFISKPIIAAELNQVLHEYLDEKKLTTSATTAAPDTENITNKGSVVVNGLNTEVGLVNNANDSAFYLRTLQSAAEQLPKEGELLQKEYDAGDWKNFGIRSHGLKSIFATIGAEELSAEGKRFEFAAKEGHFDECKAGGQDFIDAVASFAKALNAALETVRKGKPERTAKPSLVAQNHLFVHDKMNALVSALETANTKAIKTSFAELDSIFVRLDIAKVEELIDNFDYEEAAELLKRSMQ